LVYVWFNVAFSWRSVSEISIGNHHPVLTSAFIHPYCTQLMGSGVSKMFQDKQMIDAAATGNIAKCCSLINQGCDVNAIHVSNHWTPLHFAAKNGNVELAETLISLGANKSAKSLVRGWCNSFSFLFFFFFAELHNI
jgi:hypothetical protein